MIYGSLDPDSDSEEDKDTAGSNGDRRDVKLEKSGMEVWHQSDPNINHPTAESDLGNQEPNLTRKTTSVMLN